MTNLAKRVRAARRAFGESQRAFAPRIGVSQQLLSAIENGYIPGIRAVVMLFRYVEQEAKERRRTDRSRKALDGARR